MIKGLLLILSFIIALSVSAADVVDVYGVGSRDSDKIIKKYAKEIAEIESIVQQEISKMKVDKKAHDLIEKVIERRFDLIQQISKENGYKFVDFQTIFYPRDDSLYTTVEIVDRNHPERLRFVSSTPMRAPEIKISAHKHDLIDEMANYSSVGLKMIINHQLGSKIISCPVYHCVAGFEHPKLKHYLPMFNQGVIKQKSLVIETLNHDPDPSRRAAAALLVGHLPNPHEIISILSTHVADKDDGVRNNVMRVIAATVRKAKLTQIDVTPFLDALDSPYNTDRNKALAVLLGAAESKVTKNLILQKKGDTLLALMHLKQPNNHDLAYSILKKISGKDFGSTNIKAWKEWVSSAKNQLG